jgi:hypothetical protein
VRPSGAPNLEFYSHLPPCHPDRSETRISCHAALEVAQRSDPRFTGPVEFFDGAKRPTKFIAEQRLGAEPQVGPVGMTTGKVVVEL